MRLCQALIRSCPPRPRPLAQGALRARQNNWRTTQQGVSPCEGQDPERSYIISVGGACHASRVVPSTKEIACVPAENLHVSRAEFGAVWITAEERMRSEGGWYLAGVCVTCRWVALAIVRPPDGGRGRTAHAPVTQTHRMAYAELVERESLAAEVQLWRRPVSKFLQGRPGWAQGVDATFAWMWRKTGPPPVAIERTASRPATTP